jgi:hypothetical protein
MAYDTPLPLPWLAFCLPSGLTFGLAFDLAFGPAFGLAFGPAFGLAYCPAFGLAFGLTFAARHLAWPVFWHGFWPLPLAMPSMVIMKILGGRKVMRLLVLVSLVILLQMT